MPSNFDAVKKKLNLSETLKRVKDTKNFPVEKTARFAGRFFQIALAIFAWYFLSSQEQSIIEKYSLTKLVTAMWFFAITSPMVSGFLIAVYSLSWFSHSWNSRRILFIELSLDLFMTLGWLCGFVIMIIATDGDCKQVSGTSCTNFNWLVAWCFLSFFAFFYGLCLDIISLYRGLWGSNDIEAEILLDVRRTTRLR
jgi:hypothetical protein